MCLAIYKPKGVSIAKKYLRNGYENNDDGAGFAVADGKLVQVFKGYFSFGDFWKAYKPFQNCAAVIHFRIATHGTTNEENCHPFEICNGKKAVIHNGILNIACTNKDMSDTHHFSKLVLEPMLKRIQLDSPALAYLVESSIGAGNKIVVLKADGSHVIFNEKQGEWYKGAWYSNSGYKRREYSFGAYYDALGSHNRPYSNYGKVNWTTTEDGYPESDIETGKAFPDYDPSADQATQEYIEDQRKAGRYIS